MSERVLVLILLILFGMPALAGAKAIKGTVKVESGVKIADDDLFVAWSQACGDTAAPGAVLELVQSGKNYKPRALVAQKGQTLAVKNNDDIRHNSFALKAVAFDSGLQKPGSTYEVKLTTAGVVKVFCRIHSQMVSEVLVLNNPCFTEMRGPKELEEFSLKAAEGKDKIWLWSPRLKAFQSRDLAARSKGRAEFSLKKSDFLTIAPPVPAADKGNVEYR